MDEDQLGEESDLISRLAIYNISATSDDTMRRAILKTSRSVWKVISCSWIELRHPASILQVIKLHKDPVSLSSILQVHQSIVILIFNQLPNPNSAADTKNLWYSHGLRLNCFQMLRMVDYVQSNSRHLDVRTSYVMTNTCLIMHLIGKTSIRGYSIASDVQ